jgi:diaminopimelate epimerase
MGKPIIKTSDIPCLYEKETMIDEAIAVGGREYYATAVSMGNPHCVLFVDDLDFDISILGKQFETHPLFPESVNTEFVVVKDRSHLSMRVWERGSGETQACGTGACAVMYASYLNGYCDSKVDVKLLGGVLNIEYKDEHIYMTGPARTSFEGILNEEDY